MPRTYEEIIAALPEDEREIVSKYEQAQADRRVQDGIKTYLAGHPVPDEKGTLARLQRIEEAHAKAIEASELRYHVFRESMAAGVDPALLENVPFTTKESATQWIKRLGEAHKTIAAEADKRARNAVLVSGFVPGSGNGPHSEKNLKTISVDEAVALEDAGRLNSMIRGR